MYLDYQETKNIKTDNRDFLIVKVSKYGFIQICSFLEEYDILNRLSKGDENLKDTLYVCAPVVRNLKKYNGLKEMRNSMLAHVNRDKLGNFKPWWNELKGLRKPSTENDIHELYESLVFVVDMLSVRHKKKNGMKQFHSWKNQSKTIWMKMQKYNLTKSRKKKV